MVLDDRLLTVYNLIRENKIVADIGTDHAFLAAYLILNHKAPLVYACDINEGPLAKASETIAHYKLDGKIIPVLSNGLEKISADMADDIVIAGMGGNLISEIIEKAPWLRDTSKHLVLQPMTRDDYLRKFLLQNGFYIEKESACKAGGKYYCVMSVFYDGKQKDCDEKYSLIGDLNLNNDDISKAFIMKKALKFKKIADGYNIKGDTINRDRYMQLYHTLLTATEGE